MPDNPITPSPLPPTAEGLLHQLVAQNEQAMLLRRSELEQQAELTRATVAKAEAEGESARQSSEANAINRRQIEAIEKLLAEVEEWVAYFKSGKPEKAFGMVREKLDSLTHVVEAMILSRPHDETTSVLLGIIRGESAHGNTGPLRTRSNSNQFHIYNIDEGELVTALLECATFQNNNSFETLKNDLPVEIFSRIKAGDSMLVQVRNLVKACVQQRAIHQLMEVLRFYENSSIAFDNVLRIANG